MYIYDNLEKIIEINKSCFVSRNQYKGRKIYFNFFDMICVMVSVNDSFDGFLCDFLEFCQNFFCCYIVFCDVNNDEVVWSNDYDGII